MYFVLTVPHGGKVVIANLSGNPCKVGGALQVLPREYARLTKTSYLRFTSARIASTAELLAGINDSSTPRMTPDAPNALVLKLSQALIGSDAVATEVVQFLQSNS